MSIVFWIIFAIGLALFGVGIYKDRGGWSVSEALWWGLIFLLGLGVFGSPWK